MSELPGVAEPSVAAESSGAAEASGAAEPMASWESAEVTEFSSRE